MRGLLLVALVFCGAAGTASGSVRLVVTDVTADTLNEVSLMGGAVVPLGNYGVTGNIAGLAWDAAGQVLYGSTTGEFPPRIYRIDPYTAAASPLFTAPNSSLHGLAFHPIERMLYASTGSLAETTVYRIDPLTGSSETVASGLIGALGGLAFSPSGQLIASRAGSFPDNGALYHIQGGSAVLLTNTRRLNSIAFHPETGELYGVENDAFSSRGLYRIDLGTGNATLVDDLSSIANPLAMDFVPAPSSLLVIGSGIVLPGVRRRQR
jgi:DNA-binding beta-propeller fold protein YncE